jgi:hypothetical protein
MVKEITRVSREGPSLESILNELLTDTSGTGKLHGRRVTEISRGGPIYRNTERDLERLATTLPSLRFGGGSSEGC